MKTILSIVSAIAAFTTLAMPDAEATPFDCTGQVAIVCGDVPRRFTLLQDEKVRYSLNKSFWLEKPDDFPTLRSGDVVHITGIERPPTGIIKGEQPERNALVVTNLETICHKDLPKAEEVDAGQINGGRMTGKFVSVQGVVSSVVQDEMNSQWNWFVLRTSLGDVYVAATDHEQPHAKLLALTDAEVKITGLMHKQHRWRRFSGPYVMATGESGVEPLSPPPKHEAMRTLLQSDLNAEMFVISSLRGRFMHRQKTDGVLIAVGRGLCFVEMPDGKILKAIPRQGTSIPERGSAVTLAGFVTLDFGGLQFADAEFWPAENSFTVPDTKAQPKKMADLFELARNPDVTATSGIREIVSITGTIANSDENILMSKSIRIERDGYSVTADLSTLSERAISKLERGCFVRVAGVCHAEFEAGPATIAFPKFTGFSIIPMSDDAVTVLARPSWWTTGRLLAVILSLLGLLIVFFILTVVLKKLSDRRGQQLYEEKVAHIRTEAKVEERTRLAIELHDAISQTLTGVALQIDSADMVNNGENGQLGKFLDTARWMLGSCRRELQDCLWDLRSRTFVEKDMTEAINRTIAPHRGGATTSVRFNVPRNLLSESTAHSILRMVRELVVNSIRHGKASHIWIAGECSDGRISFSVRDNGCGFDTSSAPGPRDGHFGLQGIRERVRAAKGTIEIESVPSKGAKITITVPEG